MKVNGKASYGAASLVVNSYTRVEIPRIDGGIVFFTIRVLFSIALNEFSMKGVVEKIAGKFSEKGKGNFFKKGDKNGEAVLLMNNGEFVGLRFAFIKDDFTFSKFFLNGQKRRVWRKLFKGVEGKAFFL